MLVSQTPKPLPPHQAAPAYSLPKGKVAIQPNKNKNKIKKQKTNKAKRKKPTKLKRQQQKLQVQN